MTSKSGSSTVEYAWDYRNRLTGLVFKTSNGTVLKRIEYDYNVDNLRIEKRVYIAASTTPDKIERYALDGVDVVLVLDGLNGNAVKSTNFHGPGVDQILAVENSAGDVQWALTDHQGTVRDWIDNTGAVNLHLQYTAFGQLIAPPDLSNSPTYAFTGREWDVDAGLYYYRARWYDPNNGRFANDDPSGFSAGDPNLQRYVGNNSPNATDPSGLESTWYAAASAFGSSLATSGYYMTIGIKTGETGRLLGDRAVAITEQATNQPFAGSASDWATFRRAIAGELAGSNAIAESMIGVDLGTSQELNTEDRVQRGLAGFGGTVLIVTPGNVTAGVVSRGLSRVPGSAAVSKALAPVARVLETEIPGTAALERAIAKPLQPVLDVLNSQVTLPRFKRTTNVAPITPVGTGPAHSSANAARLAENLNAAEVANTVVKSLRETGQLPANYVTKSQASASGWQPGKALNNSVPGGQLGGDVFHDPASIGLPMKPGRMWYEADIGLSNTMTRAKQPGTRLLYSNDGKAFVTPDHYGRVHELRNWK